MQYVDLPFPPRIALGAQRTAGWRTTLTQNFGGFDSTNQEWSRAKHAYELSFAVRTDEDYDTVIQHFHAMRGRARKFPFRDALDYRVDASRSVLIDDGDSPTTGWHLGKTYSSGAGLYVRPITRPKSGTVHTYRTRGGITTDITGNATIDYATGWVTFSGGAVIGGDVLTWSGEFFVPARYDIDEFPALVVNRRASGELLVQCDSIPIVEVRE